MRDVVIFGIIFGLVPLMLKRPAIGALVFMWISLMNPHRFAFGYAYDFPFAQVVAIAVIAGIRRCAGFNAPKVTHKSARASGDRICPSSL